MIRLGKSNGSARSIHTEDIVRCSMCKAFLEVIRPEATRVAGVDQLYCRLEAGI